MSNTITRGQFRALRSELGAEAVRDDYSGRGMMGEKCIGFVVDAVGDIADLIVALVQVLGRERGTALSKALSNESLGHGVIFYARGWTVEEVRKTFLVTTLELHEVTYEVVAEDEDDAREKVGNGEVDPENMEFHSFHGGLKDAKVVEIEPKKNRNGAGAG